MSPGIEYLEAAQTKPFGLAASFPRILIGEHFDRAEHGAVGEEQSFAPALRRRLAAGRVPEKPWRSALSAFAEMAPPAREGLTPWLDQCYSCIPRLQPVKGASQVAMLQSLKSAGKPWRTPGEIPEKPRRSALSLRPARVSSHPQQRTIARQCG
eukprot:gene12118-biopygen12423